MAIHQLARSRSPSSRLCLVWTLGTTAVAFWAFGAMAPAVLAHRPASADVAAVEPSAWSFGEVFTFLFAALGPLNVIGPFLAMTKEEGGAFKRRVAIEASIVSMCGLLLVAAIGAATLQAWGISMGALLLAGGAILIMVALRPILAGYAPREAASPLTAPRMRAGELAFSPLAFPTIVTPYGLALLVLLFTLFPVSSGGLWILGTAGLVLALDLLVMLGADRIAKIPLIDPALNILGCVMNVLLVALGVQAVADGLHLLSHHGF